MKVLFYTMLFMKLTNKIKMKYQSTQGSMSYFTFEETLYNGWLQNNGLLVPVVVPRLTHEELLKFQSLSYKEVCFKILKIFIDSEFISESQLKGCFNIPVILL